MTPSEKEKIIATWLRDGQKPGSTSGISSDEWAKYQAILDTVDQWEPLGSKKDASRLREILKTEKKGKVVAIGRLPWLAGIAASLLLISSLWIFFSSPKEVLHVANTENLEILLPDQTTLAVISPGSSLSYQGFSEDDRRVVIEGRVYFSVIEKGPFEVSYEGGEVQVLGTQFEIMASEDVFEAACYEGAVGVKYLDQQTQLAVKEKVSYREETFRKETIAYDQPLWILDQEAEYFENDPLPKVIQIIETRYQVQVEIQNISLDRRFTGKIPTADLDRACKKVFSPLGIQYIIKGDKVLLTE